MTRLDVNLAHSGSGWGAPLKSAGGSAHKVPEQVMGTASPEAGQWFYVGPRNHCLMGCGCLAS